MCIAAAALACSARSPSTHVRAPATPVVRRHDVVPPIGDRIIRVAIGSSAKGVRLSSAGDWRLVDAAGALVARGDAGARWRIEREGARIRAVRADDVSTDWHDGWLSAQPIDTMPIAVNGRRYRGDIVVGAADSGVLAVNRVAVDEYLKGVVPEEIGHMPPADSAAAQAQAVAARSFAAIHLADGVRPYDLTDGTLDQVYGGVDAERPITNRAVESTRGLVLLYAGRVVNAPYHSTCGGSTAAASEVWRSADEPYLRPVSDRIPGSDRFYCDISPGFHWSRTFDRAALNAAVATYLRTYAYVPGGHPGNVRDIEVDGRTPSGRVGVLRLTTDRGNFLLRGNDIRFVLRRPGGEILNSTYFSVESERASDGAIAKITLHGKGNGHGVGMCQWGAIGRARAGQDFRTILGSYFPGTTIGSLD